MPFVDFIFNEIPTEIERLVKEAKNQLLLVSPFIDLSPNLVDILRSRQSDADLKIRVLFGKNEENYLRSFKGGSIEFLKQFPNIEIRYSERLHAKFYLNDNTCISTSMNLYDYSLNKNIESGVVYEYKTNGLLGKASDFLEEGLNKAGEKILGSKEVDPVEEINKIFDNGKVVYQTTPKFKEKKGIFSGFKKAELDGFEVLTDELNLKAPDSTPKAESANNEPNVRKSSLSKLSKQIGLSAEELKVRIDSLGLISEEGGITDKGKELGLEIRSYMGKEYIAYPEDLEIFN